MCQLLWEHIYYNADRITKCDINDIRNSSTRDRVVAADVEAQSNMRSTNIVPGTYSLAIFGRTEYQYKDLVLKVWASAC